MNGSVLQRVLEPKDEIDRFLLERVLLIVQNRNTMELVKFWGRSQFSTDKTHERYFKHILSAIKRLVKANSHRRRYLELENQFKEETLRKIKKKEVNVDLVYEEQELISEVESLLVQLKASLDSLAVSLNPIFELKIHGWHKHNDESGGQVLNILRRNLPKDLLEKATKLIKFLENNIEYISRVVFLRDSIHKLELKGMTHFRYSAKERVLIYPKIVFTSGEPKELSEFLDETIKNFAVFTQSFIVLTLSDLVPGLFLVQDQTGEFSWCGDFKNTKP